MQTESMWTEKQWEMIHDIADELGLTYIDMNYDVDVDIDFTTDTYDAGHHLNLRGAEKATDVLASYLTRNYELTPSQDPIWDKMLDKYQRMRELTYAQMETDFHTYLETLIDHSNQCSILISAKEEYISGLGEEEFALFEKLGLKLIREGKFTDSYLAVIQGGNAEYEATSSRKITYQTKLSHDAGVKITSSGWYSNAEASIKINGSEYALNSSGLNIVVWDNESGLVLDSVSINTRYTDSLVKHTAMAHMYRYYYEKAMYI